MVTLQVNFFLTQNEDQFTTSTFRSIKIFFSPYDIVMISFDQEDFFDIFFASNTFVSVDRILLENSSVLKSCFFLSKTEYPDISHGISSLLS